MKKLRYFTGATSERDAVLAVQLMEKWAREHRGVVLRGVGLRRLPVAKGDGLRLDGLQDLPEEVRVQAARDMMNALRNHPDGKPDNVLWRLTETPGGNKIVEIANIDAGSSYVTPTIQYQDFWQANHFSASLHISKDALGPVSEEEGVGRYTAKRRARVAFTARDESWLPSQSPPRVVPKLLSERLGAVREVIKELESQKKLTENNWLTNPTGACDVCAPRLMQVLRKKGFTFLHTGN